MTFVTKTGQKIVCDSVSAFQEIRSKYFPSIPLKFWVAQTEQGNSKWKKNILPDLNWMKGV